MDIPKGKHFNPYFDHMIIGMARQLQDGMIDYEDGTPASTPQMAYDVTNFIWYMQRRNGGKYPDKAMRQTLVLWSAVLLGLPLRNLIGNAYFRGMASY